MEAEPAPFQADYAELYDLFYAEKDYDAECDFVEQVLTVYGAQPGKSIIDIACGTGGHALRLAGRGYEVVGRDRSDAMVAIGRSKAEELGLTVDLQGSTPMQSLDLGCRFDHAICLFSSFSYLLSNEDVAGTIAAVARHLVPSGLFVFDFRNYLTAVTGFEPKRRLQVERNGARVTRLSETKLYPLVNQMHTRYTWSTAGPDGSTTELVETHKLRYFSMEELRYLLETGGFHVLDFVPFMGLGTPVEETTWNITAVAQRL